MATNRFCDQDHGHEDGLPDRDLRRHVLAAAMRAAEGALRSHGYVEVERSLEVLHVAIADADEDHDAEPPERSNYQ
jgi:hypothetical protein